MNISVFIRADLNSPVKDQRILDDYKLQQFMHTYQEVVGQFQTIIIATHQDRPSEPNKHDSTVPHALWLTHHGISTHHASLDYLLETINAPGTYMMENLRFYPGEQSMNRAKRTAFAQRLRGLAQYYLFDALAVAHRRDTSVMLLPCLYDSETRSISQNVRTQLDHVQQVINAPGGNKLIIIGGTKAPTKLSYIPGLVQNGYTVALCPPLSLSFQPVVAQHAGITVPADWIKSAHSVRQALGDRIKTLIIPSDYVMTASNHEGGMPFISLAQAGIVQIQHAIAQADTIVYNGLMGAIEFPKTLGSATKLFHAIAQAGASAKLIVGGDSVAAAIQLKIDQGVVQLSSAGGSTLQLLAGKPLPAFSCLEG